MGGKLPPPIAGAVVNTHVRTSAEVSSPRKWFVRSSPFMRLAEHLTALSRLVHTRYLPGRGQPDVFNSGIVGMRRSTFFKTMAMHETSTPSPSHISKTLSRGGKACLVERVARQSQLLGGLEETRLALQGDIVPVLLDLCNIKTKKRTPWGARFKSDRFKASIDLSPLQLHSRRGDVLLGTTVGYS